VNISEKLLATRMNKTRRPPEERLNAHLWVAAASWHLNHATVRFPSYLRTFGVFFQHFSGNLHWGSAPAGPGFPGRFSTVSATVAIV
jgi:hypothetical protein